MNVKLLSFDQSDRPLSFKLERNIPFDSVNGTTAQVTHTCECMNRMLFHKFMISYAI